MDALPEECQYLTAEHIQEPNIEIMKTQLETLWLLATRGGLEGGRLVKDKGTYPVIRELHLQVEDEGVRKVCERIVDTIMGDEVPRGSHETVNGPMGEKLIENGATGEGRALAGNSAAHEDEDEDNEIVPIF